MRKSSSAAVSQIATIINAVGDERIAWHKLSRCPREPTPSDAYERMALLLWGGV